ncbi:MAG: hypothetical protein IJF83_10935 [Methanobrevibacter sp.]|nr:hypothetical protein [Methanobrevibacter sp.]
MIVEQMIVTINFPKGTTMASARLLNGIIESIVKSETGFPPKTEIIGVKQ